MEQDLRAQVDLHSPIDQDQNYQDLQNLIDQDQSGADQDLEEMDQKATVGLQNLIDQDREPDQLQVEDIQEAQGGQSGQCQEKDLHSTKEQYQGL